MASIMQRLLSAARLTRKPKTQEELTVTLKVIGPHSPIEYATPLRVGGQLIIPVVYYTDQIGELTVEVVSIDKLPEIRINSKMV
jgi:hypothetical protein